MTRLSVHSRHTEPSVSQWLVSAAKRLAQVDSPRRTAEILLCHVLNTDRLRLVTKPDAPVPPDALAILDELVGRRLAGEPVAYLTGEKEFYGRLFQVTPDTLIPRPETELLIDEALKRLPHGNLRFADLGCGSGCLAVTLAAERPEWKGTALDISPGALECARKNAARHHVLESLNFLLANFAAPSFPPLGKPTLIVSNPPYISEQEYICLDIEVRKFEPKTALVPDESGLEHLQAVIDRAKEALPSGGLLLMEHGASQGKATRSMCSSDAWTEVETRQDFADLDRYLTAVKR